MPDHSNDVKIALWKNDKREKSTQPILKGGKPQVINGQEYWVSAWINAPKGDDDTAQKIERMVEALASLNGTYPIINVSLSPAQGHAGSGGKSSTATPAPVAGSGDTFSDEIPFSPIRGLV